MNTGTRILITAAIVGTLAYFGWRWWDKFSFAEKFDVSVDGKSFKIDILPNSFNAEGAFMKMLESKKGHFNMTLNIKQKLPFDITLNEYNLSISVNDAPIATLVGVPNTQMKPNIPAQIPLQGEFRIGQLLKTFLNIEMIKTAFKTPENVIIRIYGTMNFTVKGAAIKKLPINTKMTLKDFLQN
jgi:LEA14-like dessication related protein